MSEAAYTAPPPPPPPTQPAAYDFARPFTFVFDDPNWVPKVLVGGLFFLAIFLLVGIFFVMGYMARLTRNVIAGVTHPLPEWDDLGDYFGEGLMLVGVSLIYTLPIMVLGVLFVLPAAILSDADNESLRNLGGCFLGSLWCLLIPLSFAIMFFLPAALLMVVTTRRFSAAFEFARLWSFIKANIGNYLLAIIIYLVARFVAGFGFFLLCVGIFFTEFWALCVTSYAFGDVYRLSERRR